MVKVGTFLFQILEEGTVEGERGGENGLLENRL